MCASTGWATSRSFTRAPPTASPMASPVPAAIRTSGSCGRGAGSASPPMSAAAEAVREFRSEFLMHLAAEFEDPLVLGETPGGARRILHFRRGAFSGSRLNGQLLPGGGDWILQRRDGIAELDIRFTLRTDDGSLIYASCDGIADIAPDVRARIQAGEDVDPEGYYLRTAVFFETGAGPYLWLNRLLAVGVARRTISGM